MGSLREEVLSTPVTVGSHQIYWGSPKPYLLIWCFDHFSSGRAMFESRTRWGLWLLLDRDLRSWCWSSDLWLYKTHLNLITRVISWCLFMSRSWRGRIQCRVGNWCARRKAHWLLLRLTPVFRDGRGIGRLIGMEVPNAIRSLLMERSSDEFSGRNIDARWIGDEFRITFSLYSLSIRSCSLVSAYRVSLWRN